jgi:hypothetical protein
VRIFLKKIVLRVTYPIWHTAVNSFICRCHERGIINNDQLHEICSLLDRIPKEMAYGGKGYQMNKADKIKALLADPSVDQVSVTLKRLDTGEISIGDWNRIEQAETILSYVDVFFEIVSFDVNFHQWPDLEKGDRVLCEIGEAKIDEINWGNQGVYKVKFDDDSLDYAAYYRHELALLERGGDSD